MRISLQDRRTIAVPRLFTLIAGLLVLSLLPHTAAAQSTAPTTTDAGSSPIITANWLTAGNNAWTLPVGAQVGRVVKIVGKLPVNIAIGAYYNALRPQYGSTWQLRTQITLIF